MLSVLLHVSSICYVFAQSNTNIYGYDYGSDSNPSGLNLVQNPNYQFLNDQLANEYAKTYQQEVRQYDQSTNSGSNGNIVTSSSNVPSVGYYTGPALSNQQQNQVNYQQIVQRNPQSTVSGSTNIYGYGYSSGSNTGSSSGTYNNQPQYSAPSYFASTAQPYVYPFGQYAPNTASTSSSYSNQNQNQNQVYRDQGSTYTGQTYTLFDQPQNAVTNYQSASDLKTTTLRDQALPSSINLRGTGPLPGPSMNSIGSTSSGTSNTQVFYDRSSSSGSYAGNANAYSNTNANTNTNSRFFDVAGNQTVMYYPYRTSTNFNIAPGSSTSSNGNQVLYDQSSGNTQQTTAEKCALTDPYWCSDYVRVYLDSKRTFENASQQQSCQELVQSLLESYNGCCSTVRSAGCTM